MAVKTITPKNWLLTAFGGRYYSDNQFPAGAGEALVEWDAVSGASGYRVYYGTVSRTYDQAMGAGIDVPGGSTVFKLLTGLAAGTTYFTVTSYGPDAYSEVDNSTTTEVSKVVT